MLYFSVNAKIQINQIVKRKDYGTFIYSGQVDDDDEENLSGIGRAIFSCQLEEGQCDAQNVLNGFGRIIWSSGKHYIGWLKDGKANGWGRCVLADGTVKEGIYENHKYISAQEPPKVDETHWLIRGEVDPLNDDEDESHLRKFDHEKYILRHT